MALTPERIGRISKPYGENSIQGFDHILAFVRSIEAEVRIDDTALIRQMLEALESQCGVRDQEESAAIAAGRARLE